MGSEQSSSRRDREAGATAKDVERALEQQRRMYEHKMQKLLEEANREAKPSTSPSPSLSSIRISVAKEASAATHKDVEKALEEQRKMYDDKMNKLLEEMKRTANTSPPQQASYRPVATAALQQQVPNEFLERQRNAYNYNQNALHSLSQGSTSLYPTLNQNFSTNGPENYSQVQTNPSMVNQGGNADVPYLLQPPKPQQQPQRNTLVQPSAPPREYSATNSRSRSQSRQRGGDVDVNCPTCGKMYGERIYQCNQGHSSCDLCKTRQVPCGQCRLQLTDRRNYDLEKYIMEKKVPCPNSTEGCRLYVKMANMAIHEKECPFNELQCPSLGFCAWRGKLSQLPAHFDGMHPLHKQGDVDKEMFLRNITSNNHTMHYIRIGNFNFLFHVKVSERDARIYMAAQLIGTKHSAAKWNYEIHIYNKSEPRRKYQYSDTCSSANEPLEDIVYSTKCAVVPYEYAKTFICGGTLAYKFYIKRDDKPNEVGNAAEDEGEQKAFRRGPPRRNNFKKYVKKH